MEHKGIRNKQIENIAKTTAKLFRPFDLIVLLVVLCVVLSLLFIIPKGDGEKVQIFKDSVLIKEMSLKENSEFRVEFEENGFNVVCVEDGKVFVKSSNCLDKSCNASKCSKNGETIICLPHKLVIKVISDEKSDYDKIS